MNQAGKIVSINPPRAVPGGEIIVECEGFEVGYEIDSGIYFGGLKGRIKSASSNKIFAVVPEEFVSGETEVYFEVGGAKSSSQNILIAERIAEDFHIVANPAINPTDDSIVFTRSGGRGQELPVTLFRLEKFGRVEEISANVMNPTGLAFDREGRLYATNRADGEVIQVHLNNDAVTFADKLGIATGIAFNSKGEMFVGDRGGTIYKILDLGDSEVFATLEPSVAAYHLAFDGEDNLYVSAPSLSSFEAVKKIDTFGSVTDFYKGFGRPQGLAFDRQGNLYCAACFQGRRGIVKISPDGESAELFVAGVNLVGLCFTRNGDMIIASNEEIFRLPLGIYGTLLN